ncbi:hypothetical protein PVA44_07680 (plasmid) [Entomospira nematocerorum]|uniref:Uncharacterized protein n=1 Tax=Entomospira nematocerorum TaxID=2719987 RepID=A0A968KYQ5_9SPIO|nr:hypothetical protein [Entomospira nematocera]NIZ47792.1 hypothetical protein [Entomospira nematocera]WDI34770.1 hypothetical protein PVA44_07680 [Entomospira nematocera]
MSKFIKKMLKIIGFTFLGMMLLVLVISFFESDEEKEQRLLEQTQREEQKRINDQAKAEAKEVEKALQAQQKADKQAQAQANRDAQTKAKNPTFTTQWERLEYEIRQAQLLGIGKTTHIREIKMNVFHEDLFDEERDRRVVLIYLTDTSPNRKFMIGNVIQLLQIMHPYQDIYEIAIFFEPENRSALNWMKYAIDGNVLRRQNPDHFRIDDMPKIASDFQLYL